MAATVSAAATGKGTAARERERGRAATPGSGLEASREPEAAQRWQRPNKYHDIGIHGRKTGIPLPKDVKKDAEGFDDVDDFFRRTGALDAEGGEGNDLSQEDSNGSSEDGWSDENDEEEEEDENAGGQQTVADEGASAGTRPEDRYETQLNRASQVEKRHVPSLQKDIPLDTFQLKGVRRAARPARGKTGSPKKSTRTSLIPERAVPNHVPDRRGAARTTESIPDERAAVNNDQPAPVHPKLLRAPGVRRPLPLPEDEEHANRRSPVPNQGSHEIGRPAPKAQEPAVTAAPDDGVVEEELILRGIDEVDLTLREIEQVGRKQRENTVPSKRKSVRSPAPSLVPVGAVVSERGKRKQQRRNARPPVAGKGREQPRQQGRELPPQQEIELQPQQEKELASQQGKEQSPQQATYQTRVVPFVFQTTLTDEEQSFRLADPAEHGVMERADGGEGAQGIELETVEESIVEECGGEEAGEGAVEGEVEMAMQDEEGGENEGDNRTTKAVPEEVDQDVPATSGSGASNDDEATVPTRRSGRTRVKPLEWWKNEKKKLLDHGQKVEVIKACADDSSKDVFIKKPPVKKPSSSKKKARETQKPSSRRAHSPDRDVAEEVPEGLVYDMISRKEKARAVAVSADLIRPRLVNNQSFQFQKTFSEGSFMTCGVLSLPRGVEKPSRNSDQSSMAFHVTYGCVRATVHKTTFVVKTGAHFVVPRGNNYRILNISPRETRLFFCQSREILGVSPGPTASTVASASASQSQEFASPT